MPSRADSSAARPGRAACRVPARRGVVLIFVVAVLVLLAVIATTYLSMARADRVPPEVRGGLIKPPVQVPYPLEELRLDVFNWTDDATIASEANWRYRPAEGTANSTYLNLDFLDEVGTLTAADQVPASSDNYPTRQRLDPWMASREPNVGATAGDIRWPKISRWLERWSEGRGWVFNDRAMTPYQSAVANPHHQGFFESPLGTGGMPDQWRSVSGAIPTYVRIDYPLTFTDSPQTVYSGKVAVYPALTFVAPSADAGKTFIAADADGDGVADSGLFPLDTWQVSPPGFYPDVTIPIGGYPGSAVPHYQRWYAGVRIVDNNAQVNVNTAWRRNADVALPITSAGGTEPTAAFVGNPDGRPNYGFFRSNIGLYELLPRLDLQPTQWTEFAKYRFGGVPTTSEKTGRADYIYSTIAEALEMNLARRTLRPGPDKVTGGGTVVPFQAFAPSLSSNLAYLNGLINPRESRTPLETAFIYSLYEWVPNWGAADGATNASTPGADTDKESRSFTFFAAPNNVGLSSPPAGTARPFLWAHSMYDRSEDDVPPLATPTRSAYFTSIGAYTGGPPPRTVRQLLTASNPLATSARPAVDDVTGSPPRKWLTETTTFGTVPMEDFKQGTQAKVGINTGTYGELWRNFYLTMKDPADPAKAAVPGDIDPNGRAVTLAAGPEPLYLRSALAAVNAIDQRDGDDTITTYRIKLPSGKNVMVAGAEQQLFISKIEVVVDPTDPSKKNFVISLLNPYADPADPTRKLKTAGYRIGYMPTGGGSYFGVVKFTDPSLNVPDVAAGTTATATIPVPAPGTKGHFVLLRTRRADGTPSISLDMARNPYNESLGDDQLVCVDMVLTSTDLDMLPPVYDRLASSGGTPDWKVASAGSDFAAIGAQQINPVALDNRPSTSKRADQSAGNTFPLSGFPRDGDMLLIPYVGHYAFYNGPAVTDTLLDVCPITVDVQKVLAVTDPAQITGRFTPKPPTSGLFSDDWRARIFDNFTTLANPMSDSLPNIAEESWLQQPGIVGRQKVDVVTNVDLPVVDETAPVQGLININTADERVLSMLPFVTNSTTGRIDTAADVKANRDVAQGIIAYRQANGPFRSVVDILKVPEVKATTATTPPNSLQGNFYAPGSVATALPLPATYAQTYHAFTRVSNLLTTRSDSFTVYVVLQQWQDFGYPATGDGNGHYPLLIPDSEQRFAFTVDRSQLHEGAFSEDVIRKQAVSAD